MSNIKNTVNDELLDIVDQSDQVIGQKYRSEIYAQRSSDFRVINAFVVNSKNEVWIPRRAAHKKLFPRCLDASVGGHVTAGESYSCAFERELQEELNVMLSSVSHRLLAKLTPHEHGVSAYMQVYIILMDNDPEYNANDFESATWFAIDVLQQLIRQGEPTKGDLPILVNVLQKSLFGHTQQHGDSETTPSKSSK